MGQALYRKYRSRSFSEVAAQEHITKTLKNAIKQGNISHAYLFTGPRGTGKTSIARILAHEINNLPYSDKPHLDIIEIDAASNRRIEDIRDLREKVHIAPTSAAYKVYIIDEVHMLTTESFNALLKTLEEPPEHVVFILATTELHKLPATITSRAQRFAFRAPTPKDIMRQLEHIAQQEAIAVNDAALSLIAEHADGSFRDSISLLDQVSASFDPKHTITEADVSMLLGLPSAKALDTLLEAVLSGQATTVAQQLAALEETGTAPATIALGLMKRAGKEAIKNPLASALLHHLIDVGRSAHPQAKLLAVLLAAAHQTITPAKKATTMPLQAEQEATVVAKSLPTKKPEKLAEQQSKAPLPQAESKKATPADGNSLQLLLENWGPILNKIRAHSPPLYGALKTAEVRLGSGNIVLAFKFALHRNRVNDSKHKSVLALVIAETINLNGIAIETIFDTNAVATPAEMPPKTAEAKAVIDMMGGGEVVSVSV
ncbi:MAG TPA: DNA polymerase III subunit gamma/tau [Candidatus Saccharimonadales bacterium]